MYAYIIVCLQFCSIINIWPFTMLFLFCMNTFSLFIFVTFITLFCYAFTTPFLNKVFLELYAVIQNSYLLPSDRQYIHQFTKQLFTENFLML